MVKEIRLYIEGGGDTRYGKERLRAGFSRFFSALIERGRSSNIRWVFVMCGPRDAAFNILLVDSEGPVKMRPWAHLASRDPWTRPRNASEDSCHLMVQTVEAWLMADLVTLQQYYGRNFAVGRLPRATDVEAIPKTALEPALVSATKTTQKGEYHKIHHCSDLLGKVDPALVRARAPHCERLFTVLEGLLA
ncbi:DUF4276 family protein [Corallococcus sp. AB049A]|nr:DUF4276 family protein [Corallococcus sp. AB049A]